MIVLFDSNGNYINHTRRLFHLNSADRRKWKKGWKGRKDIINRNPYYILGINFPFLATDNYVYLFEPYDYKNPHTRMIVLDKKLNPIGSYKLNGMYVSGVFNHHGDNIILLNFPSDERIAEVVTIGPDEGYKDNELGYTEVNVNYYTIEHLIDSRHSENIFNPKIKEISGSLDLRSKKQRDMEQHSNSVYSVARDIGTGFFFSTNRQTSKLDSYDPTKRFLRKNIFEEEIIEEVKTGCCDPVPESSIFYNNGIVCLNSGRDLDSEYSRKPLYLNILRVYDMKGKCLGQFEVPSILREVYKDNLYFLTYNGIIVYKLNLNDLEKQKKILR